MAYPVLLTQIRASTFHNDSAGGMGARAECDLNAGCGFAFPSWIRAREERRRQKLFDLSKGIQH